MKPLIGCRIAACLLFFQAFASGPARAGAMADLTRMDGVVTDDKRPGFVKLLVPIAESVKDTRPSSSNPPPFRGVVVRLSDLGWGVARHQTNRGITLTLPDGVTWRKPDTVIVLDVIAPGGVGFDEIRWHGQSQRNRIGRLWEPRPATLRIQDIPDRPGG